MPTIEALGEGVKLFIVTHFTQARKLDVSYDNKLLETGILDSLGVLDLVTYLEKEFNISLADDDLTPENFQTVGHIARFVQRKLSGQPEQPQ